ncbi:MULTISPECIES: hypothetical protein [unclassified Mesorhizobium]|uniref:hypothetical protein n=1 Tax=unclassified Mesorhizobium TaxID=325217 RepID=UPI000FD50C1C|nr:MULTISPECIES: hypothetical protein [unclassified Mesorhizobium]RUU96345.1 hypothetical protein EOA79_26770 [Mesorhizobium sp. M1A.F.Ca.IN.020.03.2.1]RWG87174.1 MAG: hypothetical protein EOQ70_14240 [Mesorhizobium sp.]RWK18290.1 MAG: hypothetical protein EOR41_14255 [Mesorhizobium sp.]
MEPKRLTTDQHAALTAFALKHGDDWKQQLNRAWIDGAAGALLQPLYVSRGLSWLDGYSLADWPRSMFDPLDADPLDADPLHAEPDPMKAARTCRKLIRAHLHGYPSRLGRRAGRHCRCARRLRPRSRIR